MINLLWTGGFDSTYRLLELLLAERQPVQTYYILSSNRRSTLFELRAMEAIKKALFERDPGLRNLFRPVKVELRTNIHSNRAITERYRRIAARARIGWQYDYLARFADENGFEDMEICFIRHEPEHVTELDRLMLPVLVGQVHECRLQVDQPDDELEIFQYFRFPTIHLTKAELARRSKQAGFFDLLGLTWYCHFPASNGLPCGYCVPCKVRKDSGLPHVEVKRPLPRRVMGRMKRIFAGFGLSSQ